MGLVLAAGSIPVLCAEKTVDVHGFPLFVLVHGIDEVTIPDPVPCVMVLTMDRFSRCMAMRIP